MSDPLVEDFGRINAELKRIEAEKAKLLNAPSEEIVVYESSMGWAGYTTHPDYDPA